jgi:hypothetical protein
MDRYGKARPAFALVSAIYRAVRQIAPVRARR